MYVCVCVQHVLLRMARDALDDTHTRGSNYVDFIRRNPIPQKASFETQRFVVVVVVSHTQIPRIVDIVVQKGYGDGIISQLSGFL